MNFQYFDFAISLQHTILDDFDQRFCENKILNVDPPFIL